MQCCFGLAAQALISCVAANNIAIGEGGNSLLICDSKHFCQGECKIGILVKCLDRFCVRGCRIVVSERIYAGSNTFLNNRIFLDIKTLLNRRIFR